MTELYQPYQTKQENKSFPWKAVIFIVFLAFVCFGAWYFLINGGKLPPIGNHKPAASQTQEPDLYTKISKHIILPNEAPIISTVSDAQRLKNEDAFFANVENGDTLLIYPNTKKAVLYSSVRDILVNVGPVILPTEAPVQASKLDLKIEVRNGTKDLKAADPLMEALKAQGATISKVVFASRRDYAQVMLVNVSGKDLSALEGFLNIKSFSTLPEGEKPAKDVDAVIIFGK
jgi:hypothetical protein